MTELQKSETMREIAEKVMEEKESLQWINDSGFSVGYYTSSKNKVTNGKTVFGECIRPPKKFDVFIPYDFIIVFYEAASKFDENQLEILMHHELLHIGIKDGKPSIRPHDYEDFKEIVDAYGSRWSDIEGE